MSLLVRRPALEARRVLRRRVSEALGELERPGALEERVHDARSALKKARAALRLLAGDRPRARLRAEEKLCRKAGRLLGPARDARARRLAWEGLRLAIPAAERALAEDARKAEAAFARDARALRESRRLLERARRGARKLKPRRPGWRGVEPGLRASYVRGRSAWRRVVAEPSDPGFHSWRRRVKELRYQLDLFARGGRPLAELDRRLETLGELLGDSHDLGLLRETIAAAPRRYGGRRAGEALVAIERRDALLRRKALRLARTVYASRPKAFARLVKRYWRAGTTDQR